MPSYPGTTSPPIVADARARFGEPFSTVLDGSRLWVNGEEADPDTPVGDDDEVAVIPPVSGGCAVATQPDGRTLAAGGLTHLDEQGHARMVDVTAKPLTRRLAVARCAVVTAVDAVAALGDARSGVDPVEAARVAGMQGAKQTSSLIPLCHPIRIDRVAVDMQVSPTG